MKKIHALAIILIIAAASTISAQQLTQRLRAANPIEGGATELGPQTPNFGDGIVRRVSPSELEVRDCLVKLDKQIILSGNVSAQLVELKTQKRDANGNAVLDPQGKPVLIEVRPGLSVVKGQLLGMQDCEIQKRGLEIAVKEVELAQNEVIGKDIEIEWAKKATEVSRIDVEKKKAANNAIPGTFPEMELLETELKFQQAKAQWDKTAHDKKSKEAEVEVKEAQLAASKTQLVQRQLVAPMDAEIAEVLLNEGEWAREGDKILRLIRLDVLRISSTAIDAKQFTPEMLSGKRVTVQTTHVDGTKRQLRGSVAYASPEVRIGDKFEIRVEVQNQKENGDWVLRPGTNVDMLIHL